MMQERAAQLNGQAIRVRVFMDLAVLKRR